VKKGTANALDSWLSEFERLSSIKRAGPEGVTAQELADTMNVCRQVASNRIRRLLQSGEAKHNGTRATLNSAGRKSWTPVFLLTKKK
jgi:hypothetical protein